MDRKKYIISNWKSYVTELAQAQEILDFTNEYLETAGKKLDTTLVFCPPQELLQEVGKLLKSSHLEDISFLGVQDLSEDEGEMLQKLGVRYVIIGHSDRRWKLNESDKIVNQKLKTALQNELIPIVCIGERERDENFKQFLKDQVSKTFEGLSRNDLEKCILAYEPVWAISSNPDARPDTPGDTAKAVKAIWGKLNELAGSELWIPILYGGSVNSQNAAEFLNHKEERFDGLDGLLIGRASTEKRDFIDILAQT